MSLHRHHKPFNLRVQGPRFSPDFPQSSFPFLVLRSHGWHVAEFRHRFTCLFCLQNWWQVRPLHECHLLALPCRLINPYNHHHLSPSLCHSSPPFPSPVSAEGGFWAYLVDTPVFPNPTGSTSTSSGFLYQFEEYCIEFHLYEWWVIFLKSWWASKPVSSQTRLVVHL